jgi:hypothetical protein
MRFGRVYKLEFMKVRNVRLGGRSLRIGNKVDVEEDVGLSRRAEW